MAKMYPKLVYFIICDDIRREIGNKFSLMGIYTSESILVPALPHVFRSLFFHLVFKGIKDGDDVEIKLLDPDEESLLKLERNKINMPRTKDKPKGCVLEPGFYNLKLSKEGKYTLLCIFGEDEKSKQKLTFEVKKVDQN